jgi:hypothetical protein
MRWAGHVAYERKNSYKILVRIPGGKRPLEDLWKNWRIILKCNFGE